ncbi:MAG: LPXTG cell wall anchor domain-containing protein [Acidimicrobiia bacterium]
MNKLLVALSASAAAAVTLSPLVPTVAGAADATPLSKTTVELCVPERMEGDCEAPAESFTFPVVAGATSVTFAIESFTNNIPQVEECSRVSALGQTRITCTGRAGFDNKSSFTATVPSGQTSITVDVRHLTAIEFPVVDECPWDEEAPWRFQPTIVNDEIHGCTPGSMHVTVSAAFTITPTTTVPPTTVPPTTTAPPTTTVPPTTTTVAAPAEEPAEVASDVIAPSADPATLPVTGTETPVLVAVGVFAIALGATVMRWRRRLS